MKITQIEHSDSTILMQGVFLIFFAAAFMLVFYISRWFPGQSSNVFLALGFGLAVGIPYLLNSFWIKSLKKNGRPIYSSKGFKLALHFLSIYICILLFSALTNTLVIAWQQFVIIFAVLIFIGSLPSLFFFYYGKYQLYKSSFLRAENEYNKLQEELLQYTESKDSDTIHIPVRKGTYRLDLKHFYYAEADRNYLNLTFSSLETVQIRTTLKQFLQSCQNERAIVQIHRAYIINVHQFNRFQSGFAYIDSHNIKVPISKMYRHKILNESGEYYLSP